MTSTSKADKQVKSKILPRLLAVAVFIAVWQLAAMAVGQQILFASPFDVLKRLLTVWREPGFFATLWFTFSNIICGFFCALVAGILLALLAGRCEIMETLLWPFMALVKSVPVASFIVLCLIWLSSDKLPVFISFLMVLPIIYTNLLQGIKSTDKKMLEMADVFGLDWHKRLLYIYLPQIKPFLISACSVSLGLAWKSGIAAEVIGRPEGSIGEMIYDSKVYLATVDLFAWTVIAVTVSILFEKLFIFLLKKCFGRLEKL